jgi:hypothetical protein
MPNNYITVRELAEYITDPIDASDNYYASVVDAASRYVEAFCGRTFGPDAVSARVFLPTTATLVYTDDFLAPPVSVAADTNGDGTYDSTYATTSYRVLPLNTTECSAISLMPGNVFSASVQVTATWGTADVPAPVKQATLLVARDLVASKDTKYGILDLDQLGIRVRDNSTVRMLLAPHKRLMVA